MVDPVYIARDWGDARMVQISEQTVWYCYQWILRIIGSCNDKRHKTFPSPDNCPVRLATYRNNYIKLDINIKSYIIVP